MSASDTRYGRIRASGLCARCAKRRATVGCHCRRCRRIVFARQKDAYVPRKRDPEPTAAELPPWPAAVVVPAAPPRPRRFVEIREIGAAPRVVEVLWP